VQTAGPLRNLLDLPSFQHDFKQHLDIELNAPRYRWLPVDSSLSGRPRAEVSEDSLALLMPAAVGSGIIWVQKGADGDRILGDTKLLPMELPAQMRDGEKPSNSWSNLNT
jgi:hypothetical protein